MYEGWNRFSQNRLHHCEGRNPGSAVVTEPWCSVGQETSTEDSEFTRSARGTTATLIQTEAAPSEMAGQICRNSL